MNALSKNILSTIIYYDILDYPMTAFEVWKYLGVSDEEEAETRESRISLGAVVRTLESEELQKQIEEYRGFYFLCGRKELVEKRLKKNKLSEQKFKIIKKVVFWLQFLPYVRLVMVTGTVAMKNAGRNSDLDLLVVIRRGRLFLGRTLVTGLVHLMGKRRHKDKITDRICLNCFLTEKSLISRLQDPFSASEYFFAVPLSGQETFLEFQKQNDWLKNFKPNFHVDTAVNSKLLAPSVSAGWVRKFLEIFFNWSIFNVVEKRLEKWQTERIANDPRTQENGSIIMADSEALIFFHHAHSLTVAEMFQQRLGERGIR